MISINLQGVRSAVKTTPHGVAAKPIMSGQNAARGTGATSDTALVERVIFFVIG